MNSQIHQPLPVSFGEAMGMLKGVATKDNQASIICFADSFSHSE